MDDLEEIRRRKMQELQQRASEQMTQEQQVRQQISEIESIIKQRLTKDALQRYSNIKAADPDRATQLLLLLAQLLQTGKLNTVDDETLKQILIKVSPKKREMRIRRK